MTGDVGAEVTTIHRSTCHVADWLTEHGICIQVLLLLFASRVTSVGLVGDIRSGSPGSQALWWRFACRILTGEA